MTMATISIRWRRHHVLDELFMRERPPRQLLAAGKIQMGKPQLDGDARSFSSFRRSVSIPVMALTRRSCRGRCAGGANMICFKRSRSSNAALGGFTVLALPEILEDVGQSYQDDCQPATYSG